MFFDLFNFYGDAPVAWQMYFSGPPVLLAADAGFVRIFACVVLLK